MKLSEIDDIHSGAQLSALVQEIGFLPLLRSSVRGFSAEEVVADDCHYVVFPDGGWDWPMWKWKGPIVAAGDCLYGKFFDSKAGFVSRQWWPDFCNWRRSRYPAPAENSIEDIILTTLAEQGSLITRQLRAACGFTGPKMRSRFDGYVTRLEMACRIVTEDFVYPVDRHGHEYGWGWSLLTTPEALHGPDACRCDRTPEESRRLLEDHLRRLLPEASERQIAKILD